MDDKLIKNFRKWHGENKRNRIENDGCAVWNVILTDLPFFEGKQPRVSVVFSRYQGTTISKTILKGDNDQTIGMVLAVQSYWLDVDEYLCETFVFDYIDEFINDNFSNGNSSGSGSGTNLPCGCPDNCPSKNNGQMPFPPPPRPPFQQPPMPHPVTPMPPMTAPRPDQATMNNFNIQP